MMSHSSLIALGMLLCCCTASASGLRGQLRSKVRGLDCNTENGNDGATWYWMGDGGNKGCYQNGMGACCGPCSRPYCQRIVNGESPCSKCQVKPSKLIWQLVASPNTGTTTWKGTSTKSYSDVVKTSVESSVSVGAEFEAFKGSAELKSSVENTVTHSFSMTIEEGCTNSCPQGTYLWVQGVSTETLPGLMLPQCTSTTCSSSGSNVPRCPWGYCGDGDCQWCTSNKWAEDPTAEGLPPTSPSCVPGQGSGNPSGTCSSSRGEGGKGTGSYCGGWGTKAQCSADQPVCCATNFSGVCLPAGSTCDCGPFSCKAGK